MRSSFIVQSYLAFTLGEDAFCVPVNFVREIIEPLPISPIPRTPSHLPGILVSRGQVIGVLDLRPILHLPPPASTLSSRIILLQYSHHDESFVCGIPVDKVLGVHEVADAAFSPHATTSASPRFSCGGWPLDSGICSILDVPELLQWAAQAATDDSTCSSTFPARPNLPPCS